MPPFFLVKVLIVDPETVVEDRYLVLFKVPGRRTFDRITAVEQDVLRSAYFAGCNGIAAGNDAILTGVGLHHSIPGSFVWATGIKRKVLLLVDADDDQSGIALGRESHGIARYQEVVVIDQGDVLVDLCIGDKTVLVVSTGEQAVQRKKGEAPKQKSCQY